MRIGIKIKLIPLTDTNLFRYASVPFTRQNSYGQCNKNCKWKMEIKNFLKDEHTTLYPLLRHSPHC